MSAHHGEEDEEADVVVGPMLQSTAQATAARKRVAEFKAAGKKRGSQLRLIVDKACVVDLAFLCDTTGSMQGCINMVKTEIRSMIDQIKVSNPQCIVRLAFVGYADYADPQPPQIDFTQDLHTFQGVLNTVSAAGGGDAAEDIFSGLQAVGRLAWSSGNLVLVHVGDYPCHGQEFHDMGSSGDSHIGGDLHGRDAAKLLLELAEGCRLDTYLFCHLTQHTQKMICRFQELLGAQHAGLLREHEDGGKLSTIPLATVGVATGSLSQSHSSGPHKSQYMPKRVDSVTPSFSSVTPINALLQRFRLPASLQQTLGRISCYQKLGTLESCPATVRLAPDPFTYVGICKWPYHGTCNAAYINGNIVAKRLKNPISQAHSEAGFHSKPRYTAYAEMGALAATLAGSFSVRLKETGISGSLQYLPEYLLELPQPSGSVDIYLLEACIEGEFVRYGNNAGYVNPMISAELAHAFSHWTWVASEGRLMVTDLQGTNEGDAFTLTDPAIHCPQDLVRFCYTNLGMQGIELFFGSHSCGPTCIALGLKPGHGQVKPAQAEEASLVEYLDSWITFD